METLASVTLGPLGVTIFTICALASESLPLWLVVAVNVAEIAYSIEARRSLILMNGLGGVCGCVVFAGAKTKDATAFIIKVTVGAALVVALGVAASPFVGLRDGGVK